MTHNDQNDSLTRWLAAARCKLENGGLHAADLDELLTISQKPETQKPQPQLRQRLLYLHANGMSTHALVIAARFCEPIRNLPHAELSTQPQMPYNTVHEAILDGWRVVQFPRQNAASPDREVTFFGYEFILEKLEEYND